MINLVMSINLSPEKSTEFNQSLESIFRELANREGLLLKKMSVSDYSADIVLTWNSSNDLEAFQGFLADVSWGASDRFRS